MTTETPKRPAALNLESEHHDALNISGDYVPLPAQLRFHESRAKFRLYSGGFGSGKSLCGCREAIYHAWMYPGTAGLVGRLRMKDLELTTMKTFWEQLTLMGLNKKPYVKKFNAKLQELTFSNGSTILFSGMDDEMKLRSMQLSWAYIDEGSEVPEHLYRTLIGRIRWGVPRRVWVTTNPGASGWLRKNFIDDVKAKYELFHAPTRENIHLPADYIESLLEEYPEVWVKRYLDGSWDAFEGQVFTQADPDFHLYDGLWRPSRKHLIYEGYDFGFRNPLHVTWSAWNPDEEEPIVVFAEHAAAQWTVDRHAKAIGDIRREFRMNQDNIISFGDPAGAQVQGLTGTSYFDEFSDQGIGISPSTKEPSIRALRLGRLLSGRYYDRHMKSDNPRIMFIKDTTRMTWNSLMSYRFKEDKGLTGEDAKEQFHKENDHGVDSLGYGVMPIPFNLEPDDPTNPHTFRAAKPFTSEDDEVLPGEEEPSTMFGVPV